MALPQSFLIVRVGGIARSRTVSVSGVTSWSEQMRGQKTSVAWRSLPFVCKKFIHAVCICIALMIFRPIQ